MPDKSSDRPSEDRTSLQPPSLSEGEEGSLDGRRFEPERIADAEPDRGNQGVLGYRETEE
jgi:hypothetical protein